MNSSFTSLLQPVRNHQTIIAWGKTGYDYSTAIKGGKFHLSRNGANVKTRPAKIKEIARFRVRVQFALSRAIICHHRQSLLSAFLQIDFFENKSEGALMPVIKAWVVI